MFGLLALLAATGARAGVLDAIIVPSATVEIPEANSHEANFSTPVELAISADGSTVTAGGVDLHAEFLAFRTKFLNHRWLGKPFPQQPPPSAIVTRPKGVPSL